MTRPPSRASIWARQILDAVHEGRISRCEAASAIRDLRRTIRGIATQVALRLLTREDRYEDDADLVRLLDDLAATAGRVGLQFPEVRDP